MESYVFISVISLICYAFLFLIFASAKKIKSLIHFCLFLQHLSHGPAVHSVCARCSGLLMKYGTMYPYAAYYLWHMHTRDLYVHFQEKNTFS